MLINLTRMVLVIDLINAVKDKYKHLLEGNYNDYDESELVIESDEENDDVKEEEEEEEEEEVNNEYLREEDIKKEDESD